MFDATQFIYSGANRIQYGVADGTIEPKRAALLSGKVLDTAAIPLPGVVINVMGHPELGATKSRPDGAYNLVVNGGTALTLTFELSGRLPAQRQIDVPLGQANLPDVVLLQPDSQATTVDLAAPTLQVARGSIVSDADGVRQATLLFPSGTTATGVLPDGSSVPLSAVTVRATEYTVGPLGRQAMPAALPASSQFTYAVELSADEAEMIGATQVKFSTPIYFYVENFLNYRAGIQIPVGFYDRTQGKWVASADGRLIRIVGVTGGAADVDVTGDGLADSGTALAALNITADERATLAGLYSPGQSLWRAPIMHFTPFDLNFPFSLPPGAAAPGGDVTGGLEDSGKDCEVDGSIIRCQSQILGESVDLAGTDFRLHYLSDRAPGRKSAYTLKIPFEDGPVLVPAPPGSPPVVELNQFAEIEVAGVTYVYSYAELAADNFNFTWDGKDFAGRVVQGPQTAMVRVCFVYGAWPVPALITFGGYGGGGGGGEAATSIAPLGSLSGDRTAITVCSRWDRRIGTWNVQNTDGLGGWTLSSHHAYSAESGDILLGDGRAWTDELAKVIISTVVQPPVGQVLRGVATAPDGAVFYTTDSGGDGRVWRWHPKQGVSIVAGKSSGPDVVGIPAVQAKLVGAHGIAVAPDGTIYVAVDGGGGTGNHRLLRIDADGILRTAAGTGQTGPSGDGDGGAATLARFGSGFPNVVTVASDGSVYVDDRCLIRRLGTNGIINTVAGHTTCVTTPEGSNAYTYQFTPILGLASGQNGEIYFADTSNVVRRIAPDGTVTRIAGRPGNLFASGDGGPATNADLSAVTGIATTPSGEVLITAANGAQSVRRVTADGVITTVAGGQGDMIPITGIGDGGPARAAYLLNPSALAVASDGAIFVADRSNQRLRRIDSLAPKIGAGQVVLPDVSGQLLYVFDNAGRHLRTLHGLTKTPVYEFGYAGSLLSSVTDAYGNVTSIERDGTGKATAIIGPYGQRSELQVDAQGYLRSVADALGHHTDFEYDANLSVKNGLLTKRTSPRGYSSTFQYDPMGRLFRDDDAAGGFTQLDRTEQTHGHTVTRATALGRTTVYQTENLPDGTLRKTNTFPNGLQVQSQQGRNAQTTTSYPDGTVVSSTQGPDPRFGMTVPLASGSVGTGGLTLNQSVQRSVLLADPTDVLSWQRITDTFKRNGRNFTSVFDAPTRVVTLQTPGGRHVDVQLDARGRISTVSLPNTLPVSVSYESHGLWSGLTQGTRKLTIDYDSLGRVSGITDPLARTIGYAHDAVGRVTHLDLPGGRSIDLAYDSAGNLTALIPPGRPEHDFSYTPVELMSGYAPPPLGIGSYATTYDYNSDRQLTQVTRPGGQQVALTYDTAGRLEVVTQPGETISLVYEANTGKLHGVSSTSGEVMTLQHAGALLTGITWSGPVAGSLAYTYDNDFRVVSEIVGTQPPVAYGYDSDGLLTQAGGLNLTYDPQNGRFTGSTFGSNASAVQYDNFGDLAQRTFSFGGTALFSQDFVRDDAGRIVEKTEQVEAGPVQTYAYAYDAAGRLTNVSTNGVPSIQIGYDANGNRLTYDDGVTSATGSYDLQDRLVTYGNVAYTYTPSGDLQSKTAAGETTTYQYDALGNLRSVGLPDGTSVDYVIDGASRRIGKRVNGTLVQGFLHRSRTQIAAELDGGGNVISQFVYAERQHVPSHMIKNGTTYRIISDHLGSPRLIVDVANGHVAQTLDFDTFGRVLYDSNPGFQPFGFAGGLYDVDSKLLRFGHRDYDAFVGRWVTKDPIGFKGGDANLYAYVFNDPVNLLDIDGTAPTDPNETPLEYSPGPSRGEDFLNWIFEPAMSKPGDSNLAVLGKAAYALAVSPFAFGGYFVLDKVVDPVMSVAGGRPWEALDAYGKIIQGERERRERAEWERRNQALMERRALELLDEGGVCE